MTYISYSRANKSLDKSAKYPIAGGTVSVAPVSASDSSGPNCVATQCETTSTNYVVESDKG